MLKKCQHFILKKIKKNSKFPFQKLIINCKNSVIAMTLVSHFYKC